MNHSHHNPAVRVAGRSLADAIELLVERELPAAACLELMQVIERNPEYWKVMAVAFVEQQQVGGCIRQVAHQDQAGVAPNTLMPPTKPSPSKRPWMQVIAMAAGLLLMGSIAFFLSDFSLPSLSQAPSTQAPSNQAAQEIHRNAPQAKAGKFPIAPNVAGYVQWQDRAGSKLLPVFRGHEVDAQWLESHPLQLDTQLVTSLSRAGWQVNPSRRFVSIKLVDGEAYTIPVDDIQYRFVGRSVY